MFESPFDFGHGRTFPEMTSLVKVLEIGAKFLQEFLGESVTHTPAIVVEIPSARKITRISRQPGLSPESAEGIRSANPGPLRALTSGTLAAL